MKQENFISPASLPANFRVPAEWESQKAVYLAAAAGNEFDPSQFPNGNNSVAAVQLDMIRALHGRVSVKVMARDEDQKVAFEKIMKSAGLDPSWVQFVYVEHCDAWLRDTGPIWAINDAGETAVVWMNFNKWGYDPYIEGDWAHCDSPNYIPRDLAAELDEDIFVYRTPLIGEGGGKSFNGEGSLICCKAVEVNRNPHLSVLELEGLLKKSFNVKKIIWVEQGLADDCQTFRIRPEYGNANLPDKIFSCMGTGGHVDEYCRFVSRNKVILAQVDKTNWADMTPIERLTHARMETNLEMLKRQTDEDEKRLKIVRMPLPPAMIYTIDQRDPAYFTMRELRGVEFEGPIKAILAASYCNFLISNKVICFPKYYRPGMDERVKETDEAAYEVISSLFADHEIVQIDPAPMNAGGGGIHCISNQRPRASG